MDAGQSGCRAMRWDGARGAIHEVAGIPSVAEPDGARAAARVIAEAALLADPGVARADGDGPRRRLVAGVSGLFEAMQRAPAIGAALHEELAVDEVLLSGDEVTSHAGAVGSGAGVVVAAGTGAVTLGVADDGRHRRVDGWGHLLGDDGSGYAIGRRGLAQALRHHDGRGGSAGLAARAAARFGPLDDLTALVFASAAPVALIASFAREVADAAREGDAVAVTIWRHAATELAVSVAAAARDLFPRAATIRVSWAGSLLGQRDLMHAPFVTALAQRLPSARVCEPEGDALDGAVRLAGMGPAAPLADLVASC